MAVIPLTAYIKNESRVPALDIIGDIHSCHDELLALIEKLGYYRFTDGSDPTWCHRSPEGRRLVFLADYFDKGPLPVETFKLVRKLMQHGVAEGILGNHCNKLLRYLRKKRDGISTKDMKLSNGLQATIEAFAEAGLESEVLEWLDTLSLSLTIGSVLVAHGAYRDDVPVGQLKNLNLFGEVLSHQPNADGYPQRVDNWKHDYNGKMTHIVVGHEIFEEPQLIISKSGCHVWSIDLGCADGGRLCALRLPQEELVFEPARYKYWTQGKAT